MISVVIAHRGSPEGLWLTIASCERAGVNPEYIVVRNGVEEDVVHHRLMQNCSRIKIVEMEPEGPGRAYEFGAKFAQGEQILFLNDHVLVDPEALRFIPTAEVNHFATATFPGRPVYYHYPNDVRLDDMDPEISTEPRSLRPYPCSSAGHGNWMCERKAWEAMNGYSGIFDGYNGEEQYLGIKAWMYGFQVMMNPQIVMWHYVGKAPAYKNRDDAMKERLRRSLEHLKSLTGTVYSYEQAREHINHVCRV